MNTRYSFRVLTFRLFDDLWDREYIEKEKEKGKKKIQKRGNYHGFSLRFNIF